jgi:hypothetical protein
MLLKFISSSCLDRCKYFLQSSAWNFFDCECRCSSCDVICVVKFCSPLGVSCKGISTKGSSPDRLLREGECDFDRECCLLGVLVVAMVSAPDVLRDLLESTLGIRPFWFASSKSVSRVLVCMVWRASIKRFVRGTVARRTERWITHSPQRMLPKAPNVTSASRTCLATDTSWMISKAQTL